MTTNGQEPGSEIVPVPPEVQEIAVLLERLEEAERTISDLSESDDYIKRSYARQMEDLAWGVMAVWGSSEMARDQSPMNRRRIAQRAERMWQEHPVVKRAVELMTHYCFGRGIAMPDIPKPKKQPRELGDKSFDGEHRGDPDEVEKLEDVKAEQAGILTRAERARLNQDKKLRDLEREESRLARQQEAHYAFDHEDEIPADEIDDDVYEAASDAIRDFWMKPENKAVLTSLEAQQQKSADLQIDGEVFITLWEDEDGGLVLGEILPSEITNIITSVDNAKQPLWYERTYRRARYDYDAKRWEYEQEETTEYYQHWRNEPSAEDTEPPADKVAEGRVYHIKVNVRSKDLRGRSEMRAALEWAKGFNEYMESRLSVARIVNRVAQYVSVDGGPQAVSTVMRQLSSMTGVNMLTNPPVTDPMMSAQTAVKNKAVEVQPGNFETGASSAEQDRKSFLGMLSAATGWPIHYLIGEADGGLANMTSMELPVLKNVEARQELWRQVFVDLGREACAMAGVPVTPIVTMPNVLARDIGVITAGLAAIVTALDSTGQNVPLKRWIFQQALASFGEDRAADIMDEVFPEGFRAPAPPAAPGGGLPMGEDMPGAQPEEPPTGTPPGARTADSQRARERMRPEDRTSG